LSQVQLPRVLTAGPYLARSWEEGSLSRYYLPDEGRGFIVEVGYEAGQHGAFVLRSFCDAQELEK
jgi:hypothetical protein